MVQEGAVENIVGTYTGCRPLVYEKLFSTRNLEFWE